MLKYHSYLEWRVGRTIYFRLVVSHSILFHIACTLSSSMYHSFGKRYVFLMVIIIQIEGIFEKCLICTNLVIIVEGIF